MPRPSLLARLRSADGSGTLDVDLSRRLLGVRFSTALNKGFDTLSARLLGTNLAVENGKALLPFGELAALWYPWTAARLRIDLAGEPEVWTGRIWAIQVGGAIEHPSLGPCFTDAAIECSGHWRDLTSDRDELPDEFTGEDRSVSAADLARLIPSRHAAFFNRTLEVVDTGTNAGAIRANPQSALYDYIVDALRVSGQNVDGVDGVRYRFFAYEPWRGPILRPIDGIAPRWRLPLVGTGLALRRDLALYANRVQATSSEGSTGAGQTFVANADESVVTNANGYRQSIFVSGSGGGSGGAQSLAETELALRQNPIALAGSLKLVDWATGIDGAQEPCWRVRAGDALRIDAHGLEWLLGSWTPVIESTDYDHDSNTLTLDIDRQRVQPPRRSLPAALVDAARLVEGSAANPHDPLKIQDTVDSNGAYVYEMTADDTDFNWNRGLTTFTVPETRKYTLEVTAGFEVGSNFEMFFYLGALVDDELDGSWDYTDPLYSRVGWINPAGSGNEELPLIYKRSLWLKHGLHRVNVYSRHHRSTVGSMNAFVWNTTLTVR